MKSVTVEYKVYKLTRRDFSGEFTIRKRWLLFGIIGILETVVYRESIPQHANISMATLGYYGMEFGVWDELGRLRKP